MVSLIRSILESVPRLCWLLIFLALAFFFYKRLIMLDFDAGKLMIIGLVALVVIGPKDLPRVLRQLGQMVTKLRRMAGEFQGQFMDAMKEADLQDLRAEVAKLKDAATLDVNFDPARDLRSELTGAIDQSSSSSSSSVPGSTAEAGGKGFKVPAPEQPAAVESENFLATGIGPSADLLPSTEAAPIAAIVAERPWHEDGPVLAQTDLGANSASEVEATGIKERRKILVPRRRMVSRFDPHAAAPASGRARFVRPVRHETADQ